MSHWLVLRKLTDFNLSHEISKPNTLSVNRNVYLQQVDRLSFQYFPAVNRIMNYEVRHTSASVRYLVKVFGRTIAGDCRIVTLTRMCSCGDTSMFSKDHSVLVLWSGNSVSYFLRWISSKMDTTYRSRHT